MTMKPIGPILVGREAEQASRERAVVLAKANDELASALMREPSGLFTVQELMWLMRFIQQFNEARGCNEVFETEVNESLRTLAQKVMTRSAGGPKQ